MNKKQLITIISILIIVVACVTICFVLTNNNGTNNNLANENNNENNNENTEKFVIGEREALYTEDTYLRIDGSTATIPLSEAFKAEFLGKSVKDVSVEHNTTHNAYVNLINGNADLILVTYPSEEEFQLAKDKNVELEIIPVANEGFVFYTNVDNKVKSLTLEQIQKIYTGEITNWSEVGGDEGKIRAYQREVNSGSQTGMLNLVMDGLQLKEPLTEDIIYSMDGILGMVADYENGKNSIGYSYYYYATTMYNTIDPAVTSRIDLLAINGVEPTTENIKNGSYPIRTNYYIVINKNEPKNGAVRKLASEMLSERGQKAAEAVGYVGM